MLYNDGFSVTDFDERHWKDSMWRIGGIDRLRNGELLRGVEPGRNKRVEVDVVET